MRRRRRRRALLGLWVVFALVAIVAAGSAPAFAARDRGEVRPIWVATYGDARDHKDIAQSIAVSPDGSSVFVTGVSNREYGTVAYDASTGAKKWVARFNGNGALTGHDRACCVAVSPDGQLVFVTGTTTGGPATRPGFATIAYEAGTGVQQWVARYHPGRRGDDVARALGVSPDGSRVYVAGIARGRYRVVAYDAQTGNEVWVSPRTPAYSEPSSLAVSPDGSIVFVAGGPDFLTVAYDASTGRRLWSRRHRGPMANTANSIAVSTDSSAVFITGSSMLGEWRYLTVSYDARTGARRWSRLYGTPANGGSVGLGLAVSPDGSDVFVTGGSSGVGTFEDYATIAYATATGHMRWVRRYNGPGNYMDDGWAIGVSPDGSEVFVTGGSTGAGGSVGDYATISYDAANGARRWLNRYNGPGNDGGAAFAIGVSPDGSRVFVTGFSQRSPKDTDYTTIAYAP
jgi:DNA-binding beta-propeller fold protein YncE